MRPDIAVLGFMGIRMPARNAVFSAWHVARREVAQATQLDQENYSRIETAYAAARAACAQEFSPINLSEIATKACKGENE